MWGINDGGIQKLLQESNPLTLARALTVAQAAQTADKNLLEMKAPPQELEPTGQVKSEPIHQMMTKKKTGVADSKVVCHRCGHPGHSPATCKCVTDARAPGQGVPFQTEGLTTFLQNFCISVCPPSW